ncbi:DUF11 domain-containing protein [Calothrix sp. 336/3]|uniref:DUF11 domain-containing protein n=1 Tax=Calothrix sp. 336/3 TaxID=1337936 RepID=UPI0011875DBE|nr:DUF11 domain-containing protein [Calothrix sp. 336/3]
MKKSHLKLEKSHIGKRADKTFPWIKTLSHSSLVLPLILTSFGTFPETAKAQTARGPGGCPVGTTRGNRNFIINGNFSQGNSGFTTTLPYRGDGVYPDDSPPEPQPRGGLSVQTGTVNYAGNVVRGVPFPGDPQRGAPASNTYLYSNPNASAATPRDQGSAFPNPTIWSQTVPGLQPNTTYDFVAFFYDLLTLEIPPSTPTARVPPIIQLNVGAIAGTPTPIPTRQTWTPVQLAFTTAPGQTSLNLTIIDQANQLDGDDFGMTAIAVNQCLPNIGVAKRAGTPVRNSNGTFTVPYTVVVRNYGTDTLSNVRLTDDLTGTFANAANFVVSNVQTPTPGFTVVPNYSGRPGNINMLQGNNTLAPGASATVTFNVTITPGTGANGFGPFDNTVTATGVAPGGTIVTDQSQDGADADPDNDGNPGNNNVPTRVNLNPGTGAGETELRLVKRITAARRNNTPLSGVNFNTVDPSDNTNAFNNTGVNPVGVRDIPTSIPLRSGDEVEYTVYFINVGNQQATNIRFCDLIPAGTTYINNSTTAQNAGQAINNGINFVARLAPLPPGNSCSNQNNPNGAVIVQVGNVGSAVGQNAGFVRFRVRVD